MWSQTNVNEIIARSLIRKQQLIYGPLRVKLLLYYLNFVGIKFCVYWVLVLINGCGMRHVL